MATKQSDENAEALTAEVQPVNTLAHYLVVRHAFNSYRKGDAIRDEATILAILANPEQARAVHKVVA